MVRMVIGRLAAWYNDFKTPKKRIKRHSAKLRKQVDSLEEMTPEEILAMIDNEPNPKAKEVLNQSYGWLVEGIRHDVASKDLLNYLVEIGDRERRGATCPLTVCLFVSYMVMVLLHTDTATSGLIDRHVRGMMQGTTFKGVSYTSGHKDFYDITEVSEMSEYLRDVFFPLFLLGNPVDNLVENGPQELARVLRYNRLIGGVQLQQKRRKTGVCSTMYPGLKSLHQQMERFDCFQVLSTEEFTDDCFGPLAFGVRQPGDRANWPDGFCADNSAEGTPLLEGRRLINGFGNASLVGETLGPPWLAKKLNATAQKSVARQGGSVQNSDGIAPGSNVSARRLRMPGKSRSRAQGVGGIRQIPGLVFDRAPTFSTVFSSTLGAPGAWERTQWLLDNGWVDLQTQWVGARAFILNPDLGVYSHITLNFYFSIAGDITPTVKVQTFVAEPYQYFSIIGADIAFMVCVAFAALRFYYGLCVNVALLSIIDKFRDGWFWYDFIVVHAGVVIMGLWGLAYLRMDAIKDLIVEEANVQGEVTPLNLPSAMDPGDQSRQQFLIRFHNTVNDFALFLESYWMVLCLYMLATMIGFLRSFHVQPRMAMFSVTLSDTSYECIHLLILSIIMWVCSSISAMMLFGRRVFEFSTLSMAMHTTMTAFFGSWDWESLSREDVTLVFVWLFFVVCLFLFLLTNMFMAVIMDVYFVVKNQADVTEYLWEQLEDWLRMYEAACDWCSTPVLEQVVREYSEQHAIQRMDVNSLVTIVPGMTIDQAEFVLEAAKMMKEARAIDSISHMCSAIAYIYNQFLCIVDFTDELIEHDMKDDLADTAATAMEERAEEAKRQSEEEVASAGGEDALARREEDELQALMDEVECVFKEKVSRILTKIAEIEKFADQSVRWTKHRTAQTHAQMNRIEEALRQRAERRGASADPAGIPAMPMLMDSQPESQTGAQADATSFWTTSVWNSLFGGSAQPAPSRPDGDQAEPQVPPESSQAIVVRPMSPPPTDTPQPSSFHSQVTDDEPETPPPPAMLGARRFAQSSWAMYD